MKISKRWFIWGCASVGLTGLAVAWRHIVPVDRAPAQEKPEGRIVEASSTLLVQSPKKSIHQDHTKPRDLKQLWTEFQKKYGPNLQAEFSESGQLLAVRGEMKKGIGVSDFHLDNPQQAIARAREVLQAAQELLRLRPDFPLENAAARSSSLSVQVYFNEAYQGVMLAPMGNIKVDLGPEGELLALYADYASEVQVVNQAKLNSDQARQKAVEGIAGEPQVGGGNQVVWVQGKIGRFAYQFAVQGRQVVVDAETGSILFSRDSRRH